MSGALGAGDYLAGLLWLSALGAATCSAAVLLVRKQLGHLPMASALLAGCVILFGLVVAAHVIPLAFGVLSRPAALLCSLIALLCAHLLPRREAIQEESIPSSDPRASLVIAGLAAVGFTAWLLAAASGRIPNPAIATDVASFDLPIVARWIQSGSLWDLHEFVPLTTHGSYPHNGIVAMLAVVLPWESDFAARIVPCLALAFAGLATFALARELGAPRSSSALMTVAAMSIPVVGRSTLDLVMPDALVYACLIGGVLFLVRHARTTLTSDLVMAGGSLGLAFGTKWYGVSAAVIILVVWAAASLLAGHDLRRLAIRLAGLATLTAGIGGIWLVRNWIAYDNPLFPLDVSVLGIELFDAPPDPLRELAGASLLAGLLSPDNFGTSLLPSLRDAFGLVGALLLAGTCAALGTGIARVRRARGRPWVVVAVAVAALGIVLGYLVTPYTGPESSSTLTFINSRYGVPGLMVGAACVAWLAGSLGGRWRTALELLAGVAIAAGLLESASVSTARASAMALVLIAAFALIAFLREALVRAYERRWPVVALACVALFVAGFAGNRLQQVHAENRLVQDGVLAYVITQTEPGDSIGLAGVWTKSGAPPVLAAFGPELANTVKYVGPVVRGQLRSYASRAEFQDALRAGGFSFLIVGRSTDDSNEADQWAAELGLKEILKTARFALYDLPI